MTAATTLDPGRTAVARLLRLVEAGFPDLSEADVDGELGAAAAALRAAEVLRPAAPRSTVPCPGCEAEALQVCFVPRAAGGRRAMVACRTCGPTPVDESLLRSWRIDVDRLVRLAAEAAGGAAGAAARLTPTLWHLGRVPAPWRSKDAYLALRTRPEDRAAAAALLARRPKAVLFLPTTAALVAWAGGPPEVVLSLDRLLTVEDGRLFFDADGFAAAVRESGPVAPKRRASRAGIRLKQIRDIKNAIAGHIRAARDNAYRTKDLTGIPALLPRPARECFGAQAGLNKIQTSRCFNHVDGREIVELYERAADLDWIMFRPP